MTAERMYDGLALPKAFEIVQPVFDVGKHDHVHSAAAFGPVAPA